MNQTIREKIKKMYNEKDVVQTNTATKHKLYIYKTPTEQKFEKKLNELGYKLLSPYKGILKPIIVQCGNNHIFSILGRSIDRNMGCPVCRGYKKISLKEMESLKNIALKENEKHKEKILKTKEKYVLQIKNYIKDKKTILKNDFWENKTKNIPTIRQIKRIFYDLDNMADEVGFIFNTHDRREYLKNNPEVLKKIMKNNKIFSKGLKYEKRYDEKTNKKIKQTLKKHMLKRFETEDVWNKGLEGVQIAWNKGLTKNDHKGINRMSIARIKYMENHKGNFVSSQEIKIIDFLKEKNIEYISQYFVNDIKHKYLADIYIPKKNLIIEIDGIYWHSQPKRKILDEKRNKELKEKGYIVLRFSDKDVDNEQDSIQKKILETIQQL